MKLRLTSFLLFTFLTSSCTVKKLVKLEQYEYAIDRAVSKLNRKPNDFETYDLLQKSYQALENQKLETIDSIQASSNPNWELILAKYNELQKIQQKVGQLKYEMSKIEVKDITEKHSISKQRAAEQKLNEANSFLGDNPSKQQYQQAYLNLKEAQMLNPNIAGLDELIDKTKENGITQVVFVYRNPNNYEFPDEFYEKLKNIDLTEFNSDWIKYYPYYEPGKQYDFSLNVTFNKFSIQNIEKTLFSYSDKKTIEHKAGEPERVSAEVHKTVKHQSLFIKGELQLIDNVAMNTFEMYPLQAYYHWQMQGCKFSGDKRALSSESIELLYDPKEELANYKNAFVASAKDICEDVKLYLFYAGHKLEGNPKPVFFK